MKITGPGQSPLLLLNIIKVLNALKIPYAIIGAFAASFYGEVRASMDAASIISFKDNKDNQVKFLSELKKTKLRIIHRRGDFNDPIAAVINIKDQFNNSIDLLIGIRGMTEDAFSRTNISLFMKKKIQIIGLEDFIAMKIFAGSHKDMADAAGAMRISSKKINPDLLRDLTRHYGKPCLKKLAALLRETGLD